MTVFLHLRLVEKTDNYVTPVSHCRGLDWSLISHINACFKICTTFMVIQSPRSDSSLLETLIAVHFCTAKTLLDSYLETNPPYTCQSFRLSVWGTVDSNVHPISTRWPYGHLACTDRQRSTDSSVRGRKLTLIFTLLHSLVNAGSL